MTHLLHTDVKILTKFDSSCEVYKVERTLNGSKEEFILKVVKTDCDLSKRCFLKEMEVMEKVKQFDGFSKVVSIKQTESHKEILMPILGKDLCHYMFIDDQDLLENEELVYNITIQLTQRLKQLH